MKLRFALPLLALGLAACGSGADEPQSSDDVIAEMGELTKPEPGMYRTTTEMLEFTIPGMPEDQMEQMKQMAGAGSTAESCLTQEDADKGFEDMVRAMGEGQGGMKCEFDKFEVSGSDMDAKMTCTGPAGVAAEIALSGIVESDKSDMTMEMSADGGPMGKMTMKAKSKSERIGPCA